MAEKFSDYVTLLSHCYYDDFMHLAKCQHKKAGDLLSQLKRIKSNGVFIVCHFRIP